MELTYLTVDLSSYSRDWPSYYSLTCFTFYNNISHTNVSLGKWSVWIRHQRTDSLKSVMASLRPLMQLPMYRLKYATTAVFHKKLINQKLTQNVKLRSAQFSFPC